MAISKIQVKYETGGYASTLTGVMAPDRREKLPNEWISLYFIWYVTINKIQVEFKKGG